MSSESRFVALLSPIKFSTDLSLLVLGQKEPIGRLGPVLGRLPVLTAARWWLRLAIVKHPIVENLRVVLRIIVFTNSHSQNP
jgi:hypothetical protein